MLTPRHSVSMCVFVFKITAASTIKKNYFSLSVIILFSDFRFMCRRVMAALGRAYFFCMGFRVVVKGSQVSSSEAPILAVAPHSTFFDGIVCIVAGLPSTVSRVENLATPIFGREMLFALCRCTEAIDPCWTVA